MQYKCSDCKHTWSEESSIDICPECGSDNIKQIHSMKKWILIASGVLVLIIILLLLKGCPPDHTTAYVDFDQSANRLTVELSGDKVKTDNLYNYRISIQRNGTNFGDAKKAAKLSKVFDEPGSYSIDIKWVNKKDKMPELKWNGPHSFSVTEKPQAPYILAVTILNKDFRTKLYEVKIECDTGVVSLSNTEYSCDGSNYQTHPIFTNLKPGEYTFYARNTNDINLVNTRQETLPDLTESFHYPDDAYLNGLLKQTASGDRDKKREFDTTLKYSPVRTKALDISTKAYAGYIVTIKTQRDSNGQIIDIKVIKEVPINN